MFENYGDLNAEIIFHQQQIQQRITALAQEITQQYKDKNPLCVCVLTGAFMFFSDLIRNLGFPLDIDFIRCQSYHKTKNGDITKTMQTKNSVKGRNVLLVEDIVDSGNTLFQIKNEMLSRGALSVKTITFLDKPSQRVKMVQPDYKAFSIGNSFVVGYGLDYDEKYRQIPCLLALKSPKK